MTEYTRITQETINASVAKRWKSQFPNLHGWQERIYNELVELGPTPSTGDINRVVGNESWVSSWCGTCHRAFAEGVKVVSTGPYNDTKLITSLCRHCVQNIAQAAGIINHD